MLLYNSYFHYKSFVFNTHRKLNGVLLLALLLRPDYEYCLFLNCKIIKYLIPVLMRQTFV